jgi:serine/threonine protein kinase
MLHSSALQVERLGKGGCGEVWRGLWQGRPVAVKMVRVDKQTPETRELLLLECARHHTLAQPNLLHAYGLVDDEEMYAIVMSMLAHDSLFKFFNRLGPTCLVSVVQPAGACECQQTAFFG